MLQGAESVCLDLAAPSCQGRWGRRLLGGCLARIRPRVPVPRMNPPAAAGELWTEPRMRGMDPEEAVGDGSPDRSGGLLESSVAATEGSFNKGPQ